MHLFIKAELRRQLLFLSEYLFYNSTFSCWSPLDSGGDGGAGAADAATAVFVGCVWCASGLHFTFRFSPKLLLINVP